jgi:excisionase family DNA binding protein
MDADRKLALSVADVSELTDLSDSAVRALVEQGHLSRVPHTGRLLIARCELDRWLASSMSVSA